MSASTCEGVDGYVEGIQSMMQSVSNHDTAHLMGETTLCCAVLAAWATTEKPGAECVSRSVPFEAT